MMPTNEDPTGPMIQKNPLVLHLTKHRALNATLVQYLAAGIRARTNSGSYGCSRGRSQDHLRWRQPGCGLRPPPLNVLSVLSPVASATQ